MKGKYDDLTPGIIEDERVEDRRNGEERRISDKGPKNRAERRSGIDRRSGEERRVLRGW